MRRKNKQLSTAGWLLCVLLTQGFADPVRSAAEPDYPPLSVVNSAGKADGFSVELLRAALAEMGMEVSFQTGVWSEIKTDLAEGRLDVLPLVGRTPEREELFDFTVPYLTLHGAIFVRNDTTAIKGLENLKGQRIAVMKGDNAEEYVRRARLSEIVTPTTTFDEAFRMLSDGRADAVIAQKLMGISLLKQMGLSNVRVIGRPIEEFKQDFCFAVKKGDAKLLSALNEGLSLVGAKGIRPQLEHKWFYQSEADLIRSRMLVFSDAFASPPYSFLDEQGRATGFSVELLRAVARKTGLAISFELAPWDAVWSKVKAGKIDITCAIHPNPERSAWLDFSTPHSISYQAVFARRDSPPYKTPEDLKGRRISVLDGSQLYTYATQLGLRKELKSAKTSEEALALLEKGQVDFTLCRLSLGFELIRTNGWKNLRAVDTRFQRQEYSYAVRKGDAELLDLINDGLTQLKESGEYQKIYDQWLGALEVAPHWPLIKKIFLILCAAGALLTAAATLIIAILRRMVKKRTLEIAVANQSLRESRHAALNLMEDAVLAKERLELTQFALDHASDPAYWVNSTGRFIYVNEAACHALGYNKEELLKLSIPYINPDMPAERWTSYWQEVQEKKSVQFETRHKTKDGRVFPAEVRASYIKYINKEYLFTFSHDITLRKESEKRIRFEQNLFLSFMDTLPANVYFKDTNGRIVYVNQNMASWRGMGKDVLIGKTDFDLFPEALAQKKFEDEQRVMQTGQPIQIEERVGAGWHQTTKAPRYDENGNIIGIFGIAWDITARTIAQQNLEESRQFLRTVIDSIPTRVFWKDRNSTYLGCNLPFAHDVGIASPEEVVGKVDSGRATTKEQLEAYRADDLAVIESGTPKLDYEEPQTRPDGTFHWLRTNKIPLKNIRGEIIGVIGTYEDVTERKRKEVELRESQELFRLFMQHSPVYAYIKVVTPTESRVLQASDNFQEMIGIPGSEMAGKTMTELFPPELALKIMADDWAVVSKGEVLKTNELLNDRSYETIKFPIVQGNRTLLAGYTTDITERKRLQEAIEKRILALTRPLESSEGITFDDLFDLKEIQRIQDEFATATGVAAIITHPDGTPITQPSHFTHLCRDVIRKTEKGCANCFKSDAALGRKNSEGPLVQPCLSGGLWDAGVSITVGDRHIANWLIGQVRDETQTEKKMQAYARKIGADEKTFIEAFREVPAMSLEHFKEVAQALFTLANQLSASAYQNIQQARFIAEEKKNQAELLRLSTAIEQSPEAVMITGPDGIIQYVNPAFETITGYSREEALGKNSRFLKSGTHDAAFYSNLWKTITSGKSWENRFVNKRKGGELYTEEAVISAVRDPDGTITGYVAVKRDITHELVQEEKFRQSQKMDAIGQLTGGIAHDFNNVLQAILGFSELLLNQLKEDSLERQNALEVQKAARRAAEMTRQLLTFSRSQPMNRKRIDLNTTVREIEAMLQLLLGDKTRLTFVLHPALHEIYADPGQITQLITNLTVNARDAMPDGGSLTITTQNVTISPQAVAGIPEAEPGSFVCLSATDTGCGMSREVKDHLFEPFFTTKAVGRGTGMGLSVVYGIIKQSKGWIQVDSEEGRGATLKIYLPACKTPATNNPTGRTHNERILLVEDDEGMRNMVIQILESAGYKPVVAACAEEALELFKQQEGNFDLLFSDIVMPGKDGIELADILRKEKPVLPVLLYSGYQDQHERWIHLRSKGYHFLKKPFSIADLLTAVHGTLADAIQ